MKPACQPLFYKIKVEIKAGNCRENGTFQLSANHTGLFWQPRRFKGDPLLRAPYYYISPARKKQGEDANFRGICPSLPFVNSETNMLHGKKRGKNAVFSRLFPPDMGEDRGVFHHFHRVFHTLKLSVEFLW